MGNDRHQTDTGQEQNRTEQPGRRLTRRQLAGGALGLGLSAPALATALNRMPSAFAFQAATPVDMGIEPLDLANLSPDIPEPTKSVKLSFQTWYDTEQPVFKGLMDQFHQLHPNMTVEIVGVPAEQANDKLTTQIAGGNPPDVAIMDLGSVADFASRSAFVNLDDYISKSKAVDPDDYVAAFRASATVQDSIYGLPIDGETTALFYRTDRFDEAGITKAPTTWDEFKATAEALTDSDTKKYGFILFAPEAAYYWYPWLWQAGGDLLSEDQSQVTFNSDEGKRAAEFYVGLKDYSPPDYFNSNSYDGRVTIADGTVAMYMAGAWLTGVLTSEFPDATGKWATAPLPIDKECATTVAGDTLVLPAQAKNHDAAWKFVEFLSAPQNMALWNVGTAEFPGTLLPPRTSLLQNPKIFENTPVLKGFADAMACGVTTTISNPNWPDVEQELNDALGRAIYGEVSPSDALDEAADAAKDILAQ